VRNNTHFHWLSGTAADSFRSGVSLHSHTLHSRESLDFIPKFAATVPALQREIARLSERFNQANGRELDFTRGWWTPPLCPKDACRVEAGQIADLGLEPLVSITDHDNLDAHTGSTTAAVELTVRLQQSFVHLGIHNLPATPHSQEVLRFSENPEDLMDWMTQFPDALLVLNHPLWDEAGIGTTKHRAMIERFLARFEGHIHALELNGLRPWKENAEVIEMARAWQLPFISGGDRHGIEPNANINLTNASSLTEFIHEIRHDRASEVLFLPQYRRPFSWRIATNLVEILDDHPSHSLGWVRWSERTFYEMEPGQIRSLADYWPGGEPAVIRFFIMMLGVARATFHRPAPNRQSTSYPAALQPR
jgi:hypothetical protein